MYYESIKQCTKMVRNLGAILDKAKAHAEARKFDPNNYLSERLAPDMFAFTRQVQSACDGAKFMAARLAGLEAPKHEDNEQTFEQVRERVSKVLSFLDSLKPEQFAKSAEQRISFSWMPGKHLTGQEYLLEFALPNFYFHLTTAYALLRRAGVDVGKMDFLGALEMRDN